MFSCVDDKGLGGWQSRSATVNDEKLATQRNTAEDPVKTRSKFILEEKPSIGTVGVGRSSHCEGTEAKAHINGAGRPRAREIASEN